MKEITSIKDFFETLEKNTHIVKPPAVYQGQEVGDYKMKCKFCGKVLDISLSPYGFDFRGDMEEHIELHKTQALLSK